MHIRLTEGPAYHCIRHNSRPNVTRCCSWKKRRTSSVAVAAIGSLVAFPPTDSTSSAAVAAASDAVAGATAAVSQLTWLLRMTGGMTAGSIDCRPS